MAFRKRVYAGTKYGRTTKRRKFTRKRRPGRGMQSITNRASTAYSVGNFRSRKLSKKAYVNRLWRDTWSDQHWRSVASSAGTAPGNASTAIAHLTIIRPADEFWTAAGGALPASQTGVVPAFRNSLTLRGGIISLAITNSTADDTLGGTCRVNILQIWTSKNTPLTTEFFVPTDVPIRWDFSVEPDSQKYGKVIGRKEALLKPGDTMEVFYRHRIQKIDLDEYNPLGDNVGGNRLLFFVLVSRTETNSAPTQIDTVTSHNLSFVADSQEQL